MKADGTKVAPYVVIPAERVKKELTSISGVVIGDNTRDWRKGNLTLDWVEKVWTNFSISKLLLICDSCKFHIPDYMKRRLKQYNTVMSVIPGGQWHN